MKHYQRFGFILICLFLQLSGFSQNLESIFNVYIEDLQAMSNKKWAVAGRELPSKLPSPETFSLRILDSAGLTLKKILINSPLGDGNILGRLFVLPNEDLLITYGQTGCDTNPFEWVMEKYDTMGNSIWYKIMPIYQEPEKVWLSPDSNLLLRMDNVSTRYFTKISSKTGESLWTYVIPFISYSSSYIFVPGSEDILIGDKVGIKYFRQVISADTISYELIRTYELPQGVNNSFRLLGTDGQGLFYGVETDSSDIFRFRADLQPEFILRSRSYSRSSFYPGYFALHSIYPKDTIQVYDTLGQLISIWQPSIKGLSVSKIMLTSGGLAIAGNYLSGQTADAYPDLPVWNFGREQGWFRYFNNLDLTSTKKQYSLSIRDVIQLEEVEADSTYVVWPDFEGFIYQLDGGMFSIQIQNTGSEPIHSFAINSMINYVASHIPCAIDGPSYVDYEDYDILPGETIWVDYPGLNGSSFYQPPQFCFWTSAPNERPDDIPEDDMSCMQRTVSTNETVESSISLYPNPANSILKILVLPDAPSLKYQLFDVFGRIIIQGQINSYPESLTIDINDIPSGVYYFIANNYSKLIIIQH